MTGPQKLAVIEPQADDTTIIRGTGFGAIAQFTWATLIPAGARILTSKLPDARAQLERMGYRIVDARTPESPPAHRMPLPLPECATCHQPYRRADAAVIKPGTHCVKCGHVLVFEQHDPNADIHERQHR